MEEKCLHQSTDMFILFVHPLLNSEHDSLKKVNRFWCKLAEWSMEQGHETGNFGGQEVKDPGHRRRFRIAEGPLQGSSSPLGRFDPARVG